MPWLAAAQERRRWDRLGTPESRARRAPGSLCLQGGSRRGKAPARSKEEKGCGPREAKSARRPFPAAPPATVRTATHGRRTHPPSLCKPGLPHSASSPDRSPLGEVVTIAVAVAKASDTTAAAAPSRPRPSLCSRLLLQQAPSYPRGLETRNHFLQEWSGPTPSGPSHGVRLPPNLLSRRSSSFEPRPDCSSGLSRSLCC